ncbi:MAG: hypothetical protein JXR10_10780 [Cyclobacteriaceae bacterium]
MKKVLMVLVFIVLAMMSALGAYVLLNRHPLPEGESGARAEQLSDQMLTALGYDAYQKISFIEWSYPRGHSYRWNKAQDSVTVLWDEYEVLFSTRTLEGEARYANKELTGSDKVEAIETAWEYFANDSFWLVAPFKIRDPGTVREYVDLIGAEGLLVTYTSGGVTPGDSYLWIIGEDKRPMAWRMWTQKIPIAGLELSWDGWKQYNGAWFAPLHDGPVAINITELKVK